MTAYAIFEVTLRTDADDAARAAYDEYRSKVPALIEAAGGRYMARAWSGELLEGVGIGDRYHVVEFDDADAARSFWSSPTYREISHLRSGAAEVRAVLISPP
jgi:uncharacterized protein (DUF1330 family)